MAFVTFNTLEALLQAVMTNEGHSNFDNIFLFRQAKEFMKRQNKLKSAKEQGRDWPIKL